MANLATITTLGGVISLGAQSGGLGLCPANLDTVTVGTEIFTFHQDRNICATSSYVWTGLDASQSADNLRDAINHTNRGYYQRPHEDLLWVKTDPRLATERHFDGRPYTSNLLAISSGSTSGSCTVTVAAFPNGY